MKNEEILGWLASNWHELERQVNRWQRIRVADDEEDVRQVSAEVLSRLGHNREQPRMAQLPGKFFRARATIARLEIVWKEVTMKAQEMPVVIGLPNKRVLSK